MFQGKFAWPWRVQREIATLKILIASCSSIYHCYREANRTANILSNLGLTVNSDHIFLEFESLPKAAWGELKFERLGLPIFRYS